MDCKVITLLCLAIMLPSLTGCNLFGRGKIAQLETESERLLSEYRYERERADRLDILNRALTDRVGQLEKRLAVSVDGGSTRSLARRSGSRDVPAAPANDPWQPALQR